MDRNKYTGFEIAVTGMACRFPGASDVNQFWENLKNGVDSVSVFSEEELREFENREEDLSHPKYVKSKGLLEDAAYFDAAFFGFSPNEANILDPQIRILAQAAYHALEDSGYNFVDKSNNVGVFVGALPSVNWQLHCFNKTGNQYSDQFSSLILNDKDFAGTRLSYLLDLHGPSSTVFTACSTSLVTVDMACQSLLTGKSDLALAGGIAISLPYKSGYTHEQGMIMSEDGHTRSFDANATGTVWGDGVGMVVLKRLEDAIQDGDQIHAIIKGSSVNNDGNRKIGYTAPSIQGQVDVIKSAMNMAEVRPEDIHYIEGHGSATSLGDKIEISALNEVFKKVSNGYKCPIGSVKSNIGHLNTAAGIAGFIKVCLMLKHAQIPPTAHFKSPNSTLKKAGCPFYVTNTLQEWKSTQGPLRAGVSSFGIGGTNAHVVLEKAPAIQETTKDLRSPLVVLSAKSREALQNLSGALKQSILQNNSRNINHLAYTLQIGRQHFQYRKSILVENKDQLIESLSKKSSSKVIASPKVVMMFPGMGTIYRNLGKDLYQKEEVFRNAINDCFSILENRTGLKYESFLYPDNGWHMPKDFQTPQLLTFSFEYALTVLLKSWGILPDFVIGYSLGEYVAACIAGVFSLESALEILLERGRLVNTQDSGGMLSVPLSSEAVRPYLNRSLNIAIDNGKSIVVAGSQKHLNIFKKALEVPGIGTIEINPTYALHSAEMQPILNEFEAVFSKHMLQRPSIPMISNVTGTWCNENITTARYWAKHLSSTINFHQGISNLIKEYPDAVFLEVGAGNSLGLLARRAGKDLETRPKLISFVKKSKVKTPDHDYLLKAIGNFWEMGGQVNWRKYHEGVKKNLLSLPNYPFERKAYGIVPDDIQTLTGKNQSLAKRADVSSWFYVPVWQQSPLLTKISDKQDQDKTILFLGSKSEDIQIIQSVKESNHTLHFAEFGKAFKVSNEGVYGLNYTRKEDLIQLFKALETRDIVVDVIVDLTNVDSEELDGVGKLQRIVNLFQVIAQTKYASRKLKYCMVAERVHTIVGNESNNPWNATLLAATKVIPQENPLVKCRFIETDAHIVPNNRNLFYRQILKELESTGNDQVISYRGNIRWIETALPYPLEVKGEDKSQIQKGGTYIIIGGLGDVGYELSKYLLEQFEVNLVLVGRSALPNQSDWDNWLKENDSESALGRKLQKAKKLTSLKGTLELMQADATIYEDLASVFDTVNAKFKQIDGVFHAAGSVSQNAFNLVDSINEEQLQIHFPVKTKGLEVLKKVVEDYPPSFVAIMSSLSSILGGLGMIGYAAANQYMDALVVRQNNANSSTKWQTFNFSNWKGWDANFDGISLSDSALETFITPEDAPKVFNGLFSKRNAVAQVMVSPVDLFKLKEKWENIKDATIDEERDEESQLSAKPEVHNEYKAPSTDLEKQLVKIWEEIFGFGPIGILDDFMELGGDSMKAISVISRLKQQGYDLKVEQLLKKNIIEELAKEVEQVDLVNLPKILPVENKPYYMASSVQKRLFYLQMLNHNLVSYNEPVTYQIKGNVDKEKIENAFFQLILRHESLRTSFKVVDSEIVQVVHDQVPFNISHEKNTNQDFDSYIKGFVKPFDLIEAPLFRVKLIEHDAENYLLIIDFHHIIIDALSINIIIKDFMSLYQGLPLEPLKIQYKSYSEWKASDAFQEVLNSDRDYWIHKLSGSLGKVQLPVISKETGGNKHIIELSEEKTSRIKEFAKRQEVTLNVFLQAIFNVLLSKVSYQENIILGTPMLGRQSTDLENVVGMFVNTVVLLNHPSKEKRFLDFLVDVKTTALEAFEHQEFPFDELVQLLDAQEENGSNPIFNIMFEFINVAVNSLQIDNLQLKPKYIEDIDAKFDLTLEVQEQENCLKLKFKYAKKIFNSESIKRLSDNFLSLIEQVLGDANNLKLHDLTLSSKTEEQNLLQLLSKPIDSEDNDFK